MDRPPPLVGQLCLRADRPAGREADFKPGRIGTGDKKTVERADREPIERLCHSHQQIAKKESVGSRAFDGQGEGLRGSRGVGSGGSGQPVEHASENFSGSLAGKCGGKEIVHSHPVGQQSDCARGERVGLAGAGAGPHRYIGHYAGIALRRGGAG